MKQVNKVRKEPTVKYLKKCEACGKEFEAISARRKYCCTKCKSTVANARQRRYNEKNKEHVQKLKNDWYKRRAEGITRTHPKYGEPIKPGKRSKYGCAYCADSVQLKAPAQSGASYDVKTMYCTQGEECPYKDEFKGTKNFEEWYDKHKYKFLN